MIQPKIEIQKTIDLNGPEGNAFYLISIAKKLAIQLDYLKDKIEEMVTDMTKSDYGHLVSVFEKHFGHLIILYR